MRRLLVAAAVLLVLSFPSALRAQITDVTDDTIAPIPGAGHDYIHLLSETVNPANGSVSVNIGLPAPKGRGISLPFAITYNSGAAGHYTAGGGFIASQAPFTGGWGNSLPNLTLAYQSINFPYGDGQPGSPTETCYFTTGYMFTDVFGGSHALGLAAASLEPFSGGNCTEMGSNIPSFNPVNSGGDSQVQSIFTALCGQEGGNGPPPNTGCSYATPPLLVFDKAGTIYSFAPYGQLAMGWTGGYTVWPVSMEDRNGNIIKFTMTPAGALTVTDTAGRALVSLNGSNTNGYIPTVISVGGLTYNLAYTTANIGYTPQVEGLAPPDGATNPPGLNCNQSSSGSATPKVVSSITLPNNETYQFTYDPTYGTLSKIQYPDGGWVKYTWKLSDTYSENDLYAGIPESGPPLSLSCNYLYKTPVVATREVGFTTSTTPVLTQTFTYNTNWNPTLSQNYQWTSKSTTVQTTDNVRNLVSQTAYTYWPVGAGPSGEPGFAGSPIIAGELAVEHQVQYNDWGASTPGPVIRTVVKTWADQFNLLTLETILDNNQTSEITYQYGFGGAITQEQEYDFGLGAPSTTVFRTTVNTYQAFAGNPLYKVGTQSPSPTLLTFPCRTIVYNGSAVSANRVAETDYLYDGGTATCGTAGTPSVSPISGGALPTGTHDETYYGSSTPTPAPRGNVTTITQQCFPGCTPPSTSYTYDETGQVLSKIDPLNAVTQYSYADSYTSGTPSGDTNAYLTKVTRPTTANGVAHISNYSYRYMDGQLTVAKDENGQSTTYTYGDPLNRLAEIVYPISGGETLYTYNDAPPSPSVTTQKEIVSGTFLTTVAMRDGMGHVVDSQVTSAPVCPIVHATTTYDGMAEPYRVSNPYCTTSDPTYGLTTYSSYDVLGRIKLISNPDSSTVQTSYTGRATEVTDEGNGTKSVQRVTQTDAFGRLKSVCEVSSTTLTFGSSPAPVLCGQDISPMGFLTSYSYDILNDLVSVSQGGLNQRTFAYDSLSRLTSSTNPESGNTGYSYDVNGNLISKISPKPNQTSTMTVTTTYTYDTLNRIAQKSYSDGTPTAYFIYDISAGWNVTQTNIIGRMSEAYTNQSVLLASIFGYDSMGRVVLNNQDAGSSSPSGGDSLDYVYNLLGDMISATNGAGVTLTYGYNSAAELTGVTSSLSDANHPSSLLSSVLYNAPGSLTSASMGTITTTSGISESRTYTNCLRPLVISTGVNTPTGYVGLEGMTYGYAPNGDVTSLADGPSGNWTFTYDDFNRLKSTVVPLFGAGPYAYVYDRYGNRWQQTANGSCNAGTASCISFDANNHVTGGILTYDAAGNVTADNMHHYTYDAENHLTQVDAGTTASYVYDALGRRIQKTMAGTTVNYLYDLNGHVVTELSSTGAWNRGEVYAAGRHLVTYRNGLTYFSSVDALGSERVHSTQNESSYESCVSLPFGDGQSCFGPAAGNVSPLHFTSKERDAETGNDYFDARYYSSAMGRFVSPDWSAQVEPVPYAKLDNPQSLNLYSYVLNNPLTSFDDDGHQIIYAPGLKNEQLVRDTVQAMLADPHTSGNLSGYVGTNNPDLIIRSGDLSSMDSTTQNPDGTPAATVTQGVTQPDIQTTTSSFTDSNGVTTNSAPQTTLTGTTITIDNRTSAGDTPGVLVHETDHAGEARANPAQYKKDAAAEKSLPHDKRPQEQRANAAQRAYGPKIKKAVKQIEKDRKKENQ